MGKRRDGGESGRKRKGKHLLRCKIQKEMEKERKIFHKFMRVMESRGPVVRDGKERQRALVTSFIPNKGMRRL